MHLAIPILSLNIIKEKIMLQCVMKEMGIPKPNTRVSAFFSAGYSNHEINSSEKMFCIYGLHIQ